MAELKIVMNRDQRHVSGDISWEMIPADWYLVNHNIRTPVVVDLLSTYTDAFINVVTKARTYKVLCDDLRLTHTQDTIPLIDSCHTN